MRKDVYPFQVILLKLKDLQNAILNLLIIMEKKKELKADGLLSTCIQHEIDHLNGILFIDYLSKLKKDMIIKKLTKQKKSLDKVVL